MQQQLQRKLSYRSLTLYGLGTMLGAGIYVLIAEIASQAGIFSPLAFILAAIIVSFSAHSYGQMARRYPQSAGEAAYINQTFHWRPLTVLVGYGIMLTGIVSAAAMCHGLSGYLTTLVPLPRIIWMFITMVALGWIASHKIEFSSGTAIIITLLEVAGVILIIASNISVFADLPSRLPDLIPSLSDKVAWQGIGMAAFLAFYAFVGFEDMVNMAEEVKHPQRDMPRALFMALILATILYILTALVAVLALPLEKLQNSTAPFVTIAEQNGYVPTSLIAGLSVIAIVNGALVQLIMASRVLYGLARQGLAPWQFALIHRKTHTPVRATRLLAGVILIFALALPLTQLATITSALILMIFALINLCYAITLRRENTHNILIPVTGFILTIGFLLINWL